MKALFLIFHGFDPANGISKKIRYQVKALQQCGLEVNLCYYDVAVNGHRRWMVDDKVIKDLGCGTLAKLRKRIDFSPIINYVRQHHIDFVYMRSYHNANPFTIHLVKAIKKVGARMVMEIPTYPYDQEYITADMKRELKVDRYYRPRLAKALDAIVTFSNEPVIFGQRTIRISNGIDFDAIPLKTIVHDTSKELHLIGVAEIHYWHGFDRLVAGLANYYKTSPEYKVYFDIVGPFGGELERSAIMNGIESNQLQAYVKVHGPKEGAELDDLFNAADFAIGSLGRHRSGITFIKTLKNREYAARGFSFIYSETDDDFEHKPFVLKAPADESPIDIQRIIDFNRTQKMSPAEIRASVEDLSWKAQMQKVINKVQSEN